MFCGRQGNAGMAAPSSVSSSYSPYVGPRRPFLRDGEDSASPPSPMRQFDFDESPSRRRGADALRQSVRSGRVAFCFAAPVC